MSNQETWEKLAAKLRRQVSLGWFWQFLSLPLVGAGFFLGAISLWSRWQEKSLSLWFWGGVIVGLAMIVAWAAWRARANGISQEQALVRLEADQHLHNALTTAAANKGEWPQAPSRPPKVLQWCPAWTAGPLLSALTFLLLGVLVPIAPARVDSTVNEPYLWKRLAEEAGQLVEQETIDKSYQEDLRNRLEELRSQKADEWFSPASLEATDHLHQAHLREIESLARDLGAMEESLRQAGDPKLTEEQRENLQKDLAQALDSLRDGQMKPNENLFKRLKDAAQKGLGELDPQAREELRQKLAQRLKELEEMMPPDGPG